MDLDLILKCRICEKILQPPVRRCGVHSMHLFCQKCITIKNNKCTVCQNPVLTSNNVAIEALLKVHKFKCNNENSKVQLISVPENLDNGRYECEVNKYCELRNPCTWIGGYNQIAQHFYSHIHLMTLINSTQMTIQINKPNRYLRLLKAHDHLFWYKHVVNIQKQKVYFIIQTINYNKSKKFEFKIIFSNGNEIWSLYGDCSDDTLDANAHFLVEKGKDVRFQDLLPFIRGESFSMVLEVNEKQNLKLPNSNYNKDGNSQTTKQSVRVELKQNERVNGQTAKNVVRVEPNRNGIGPIENNQGIGANHRQQRERDRSRNTTDNQNNLGIDKSFNPVKNEQNDKKDRIPNVAVGCDLNVKPKKVNEKQSRSPNLGQLIFEDQNGIDLQKLVDNAYQSEYSVRSHTHAQNEQKNRKDRISILDVGRDSNLTPRKIEVTQPKGETSFRASCLPSLVKPNRTGIDPNPSQLRPTRRSKKTTQNQNDNGIDKSHTQGQNEQTNRNDKMPILAEERNLNVNPNKLEITQPKDRYETSHRCLPNLVEPIPNRNRIRPIQSTQGIGANFSQLKERYQSRNITANQNDNGPFKNCCDIL